MRRVSYMNESCLWMSHESWLIWTQTTRVPCTLCVINKSCLWMSSHVYEWVMSHDAYGWVMTHLSWVMTHMYESWLIRVTNKSCSMTHLCHRQVVFLSHSTRNARLAQDALSCRSLSAKEPLIMRLFCGRWPVMSHTHSKGNARLTLIQMSRVPYMNESCRICQKVMSRIHSRCNSCLALIEMSRVPYMNESCRICQKVMLRIHSRCNLCLALI